MIHSKNRFRYSRERASQSLEVLQFVFSLHSLISKPILPAVCVCRRRSSVFAFRHWITTISLRKWISIFFWDSEIHFLSFPVAVVFMASIQLSSSARRAMYSPVREPGHRWCAPRARGTRTWTPCTPWCRSSRRRCRSSGLHRRRRSDLWCVIFCTVTGSWRKRTKCISPEKEISSIKDRSSQLSETRHF